METNTQFIDDWNQPPIDPKTARAKLDCLARKDKVLNDAHDAIRDGQSQMALRIITEELNYKQ